MVISYRSLPERILKVHAKTTKNYEYIQKDWGNIQKEYSGQFVAVANGKVIYNTKNYKDLLDYLSQHRSQRDLIAVRIRPQNRIIIL